MKWGILATGKIAHTFAETVAKMEEEECVAAVASRSLEKAQAFAQEFDIPLAFGSYEELAACGEVEAVYVAAPNLMHDELVRLALSYGKHVLCEKPLTTSAGQSRALYELASEKHLFLMEAFWVQFLPLFEKLRSDLPRIGQLQKIECDYGFVSSGPRRLTKLKPELGGGALMDIGIYCLGFLQIVHPGKLIYRGGSMERCEYGTDEESIMEFSWEDGAAAHVSLSVKREMPRRAVITGSRGKITLPDFQQAEEYTVYPEGEEAYTVKAPVGINGYEYEIRECTRCVAQGRCTSEIYTPQESLALIGAMDEVREAWNK